MRNWFLSAAAAASLAAAIAFLYADASPANTQVLFCHGYSACGVSEKAPAADLSASAPHWSSPR